MMRHHPQTGELIVHWSFELIWKGLAAGALLGLTLTTVILGAALIEPHAIAFVDWLTGSHP